MQGADTFGLATTKSSPTMFSSTATATWRPVAAKDTICGRARAALGKVTGTAGMRVLVSQPVNM